MSSVSEMVVCCCCDAGVVLVELIVELGSSYLLNQWLDPVCVVYEQLQRYFVVAEEHRVDVRQVLASKIYRHLAVSVIQGL